MKNISRNYFLFFGLLLLLISYVAAIVMRVHHKKSDIGEFFQSKFEAYPNVLTGISRSDALNNPELAEIMSLYEKGEYLAATKKITQYLKNQPDQVQLKLYRGICYLQLNETGKAENDFRDVVLFSQEFADQAEWYLALTYLKMESLSNATDWFTRIVKKQNDYSAKAQEALEGLKGTKGSSKLKIYELTEDGKSLFIYPNEENPVPHPITDRTLYLEASGSGIIPAEYSYADFLKLSVADRQNILKSGQQDTYARIENDKKDLYEKILALLPKPNILKPLGNETDVTTAKGDSIKIISEDIGGISPTSTKEDSVGITSEIAEIVMPEETTKTFVQQKDLETKIPDKLKLPWIIDLMLQPEEGLEVPDKDYDIKGKNKEIPWVINIVTKNKEIIKN